MNQKMIFSLKKLKIKLNKIRKKNLITKKKKVNKKLMILCKNIIKREKKRV